MKVVNKIHSRETQALVGDEINLFREGLATLSNEIYSDIFSVGVNLSLRISDLLHLRFSEILDESGKVKEKIYLREGKTQRLVNKAPRQIILNKRVRGVIIKRRLTYPDHEYLFQSTSNRAKAANKPISRQIVEANFSKIGEIYVGKNIGTHSLRKTKGRSLYDAGIRIEEISKVLGHNSSSTTLRYLGIDSMRVDELNGDDYCL